MGQNELATEWPEYKTDESSDDVTSTEYVVGLDRDEQWIAGVLLKARLDALAVEEAYGLIRAQAVAALREKGLKVREIEQVLKLGGASRSQVSRDLRRRPERFEPEPVIDRLVETAWREGPQYSWVRPAPREGDLPRGRFRVSINMLNSL
ncbi:hypothetical protein [Arthrobacter sp. RCC_34]|uniref:hypothetical protein n=1 Tax=Arthrobacter sp. RCC_34 TaxID=3239230 RepID=UPI00352402AD